MFQTIGTGLKAGMKSLKKDIHLPYTIRAEAPGLTIGKTWNSLMNGDKKRKNIREKQTAYRKAVEVDYKSRTLSVSSLKIDCNCSIGAVQSDIFFWRRSFIEEYQ